MMNGGFKYIDDELQNLKQLLTFRLDDVIPQEPVNTANSDPTSVRFKLIDQQNTGAEGGSKTDDNKPPYHYADLIEFALRDKTQLTVSEIYDWILERFPYFKQQDESRWKPAVRHTLTTNPGFYKAKKANRGFLWAYRDASQRRLLQAQQRHVTPRPEPPTQRNVTPRPEPSTPVNTAQHYNWKKKVCAMQSDTNNNSTKPAVSTVTMAPINRTPSTSMTIHRPPSTSIHTNHIPRSLHTVTHHAPQHHAASPVAHHTPQHHAASPVKRKSETFIPVVPTLSHCNKTMMMDSSDDSSEEACGECTCKVEYFIPRLPSDIHLDSNSATCIPCCKGDRRDRLRGTTDECCTARRERSPGESSSSDWSKVWDQVHGPSTDHRPVPVKSNTESFPSTSSTQLLLPSRCAKPADREKVTSLSKNCVVVAHAPSVRESSSGHLLCVPVAVPVYRKAALLKKKYDQAKLHQVSRAAALAESGLMEERVNLSRITSVPSSHSVCSSGSNSDMFKLDALDGLDTKPE